MDGSSICLHENAPPGSLGGVTQATLSNSRCLIFCCLMGSNRYDQRDQRARTFDSLMQVQLESRGEVLRTGLYHDEIYGILRSIAQLLFLRKDAHDGFIWLCVKEATSYISLHLPIYECVLKKVDFFGFSRENCTTRCTDGSWFFVAFFTFTLPLRPQATSWFFVAQNQSLHTLPCD